jgi:type VI secretion system secreted protein VgrG
VMGDSTASAQPAWGLSTLEYNEAAISAPRLRLLQMDAQPYVAGTRVRTASEFLATNNVGNVTAASGAFSPPADIKAYRFEQQMTAHRSGIAHGGGATASDAGKLPADTTAYSRLRQERAESLAVVYSGVSGYVGLESGAKTEVKEHPNDAMNVSLYVIAVQHRGSNGAYEGTGVGGAAGYTNEFQAIPSATPFRPPLLTPWPHVGGSHVGTVVGPAGEEIYTDKHGRVQVVFKWDLEDAKTLDRSCWIRVAQSFAGQNYGSVFLPRIGHEVLVEFLDGNPDNPVVVGSLYNSANLPPWTLPDNKTQSGIKTKSSLKGGADNFNELLFEDKKGNERINVQAEKDLITLVKNDETRTVGHDRTTTIKHDETKTVKEGNETTTIELGWQKITVADNNRTLHVEKEHTITVNGNEQLTVAKDRTVTVDQNQITKITKDHTVGIDGKQTRTIKQDDKTTVSMGNSSLEVSMGNIDMKAPLGNITIEASLGKITLEAMTGIELKCGASSIKMTAMDITIQAPMVTVEGQIMNTIKGAMIQVDATGMLMAKGIVTMIG